MKTKEEVLNIFNTPEGAYWAYREGLQEGFADMQNALRNQTAIAAMQGILSNTDTINQYYNEHKEHGTIIEVVVNASVTYADALIKELNKNYLKT